MALGWSARLLDAPGDADVTALLGLDRDADFVDVAAAAYGGTLVFHRAEPGAEVTAPALFRVTLPAGLVVETWDLLSEGELPIGGEAGPKVAEDCGGLPVDPDTRTFERDEAAGERRLCVSGVMRCRQPRGTRTSRTSTTTGSST